MKSRKKIAYIWKSDIYILLAENRRLLCHAFFWGIPFAASCVLGWRLVHEGTVFGCGGSAAYAGSFLLFLLETAVLSVPAAGVAAIVMRVGKGKQAAGKAAKRPEARRACQVWLFSSLLIFLCWLPVFFAYYPSVFAYDA